MEDIKMSLSKDGLSNQEKELVIAQALETDEGRTALAQAMVEPIRRSLEYQAVGRKLLMVDELPQGALARYERDPAAIAYVVSRRGAVPDQIQTAEEVLVPTFEIATNPTVRLAEIKARRFYIVDRAQIKAKEAIQKEEDTNIFGALVYAAINMPSQNGLQNQVVANTGTLTVAAINSAFRLVEQHDLVAAKMVMHAFSYAQIRTLGKDFYDEASQREIITTGLFGHLWTADLHVSSRMAIGNILVVAPPENVGAFPIRQDITVLPADDPKRLSLGWVIYEEIGIVIINDYAISLIQVTSAT
jgi:hypothetical protein